MHCNIVVWDLRRDFVTGCSGLRGAFLARRLAAFQSEETEALPLVSRYVVDGLYLQMLGDDRYS